ncbi:bifunctional diaminohydroxyphosphoribosylaminopyrimidine deaminase/5-amino-6-(5-phosphoribosylamino)uracil reductase RibD [Candidatus Acetothermia bacterium]|nr:bifunctional diaminohydroxyphosphoribosylaminopyrimidine deaminase/5-amino-6-(5-phosphoribosylamino)uracil reductase RibD [Candidatus Acetothermia bacterium]MBI3642821.1 bifunctional diaminohydroxyphosphoribosylaminopyrimidine deaminase/5-amino-6-(5-phosphoribosylamino)uracil reductase RibD [Candidatus Acetothermia bacterium]
MQINMNIENFMRRAIELAELGSGYVNPNPLVGAVLVKEGKIIAEAYHERFGEPHAEALALQRAGKAATDADLYVNWEPCISYPGKRTPACVDQIISSGIRRIIVATSDPTPEVNGKGIQHLRKAGIEVIGGILENEAKRLNEIRAKFAVTGRPFVLLKMAMTADGKIATRTGDSQWVSSGESLKLAHRLRVRYAAVLVGIGTVLHDDPQLTVRKVKGRDPIRIVLDSKGQIPLSARLFYLESQAPTIIATCCMSSEKAEQIKKLKTKTPIEIWRLPEDSAGHVDLNALVNGLGERQIDSLLVEGGSGIAAAFLQQRLLDKLTFIIAPKLLGGESAPTPIGGQGIASMAKAISLKEPAVRMLGNDVVYEAAVDYASSEGQ